MEKTVYHLLQKHGPVLIRESIYSHKEGVCGRVSFFHRFICVFYPYLDIVIEKSKFVVIFLCLPYTYDLSRSLPIVKESKSVTKMI